MLVSIRFSVISWIVLLFLTADTVREVTGFPIVFKPFRVVTVNLHHSERYQLLQRASSSNGKVHLKLSKQQEEDEESFRLNRRPIVNDPSSLIQSQNDRKNIDDDDDDVVMDPNFLDDLIPPPVNFARNSILFSDNPSTKKRNNIVLDIWRTCRTYLPAFVTGAWPWRNNNPQQPLGDDRPLAALYNMILVRLPVVTVGIIYWKQLLWDHHDLIMDFGFTGNGPQVMNPLLVTFVLCFMLL